ncbi:hypothetical protein KQX54_019169 [Cotesia glomerata]|uniref:Uncharacterized protein n=1 Tax=Cotesia glomerata TaxID=32391 RepID=A0AAV7HYV1_COTGL|nr:hypothetical protein KQX54_019169 [Cotesia glomerata]
MKMAQVISNRTKFPIYYVIGIERLAGQNRIIVTGLPVVATRGGGIKTVGHPTARKPCQDYQYTLGMDSWKYDCILKEAGVESSWLELNPRRRIRAGYCRWVCGSFIQILGCQYAVVVSTLVAIDEQARIIDR